MGAVPTLASSRRAARGRCARASASEPWAQCPRSRRPGAQRRGGVSVAFDVAAIRAGSPALADGYAYLDGAAGTQTPAVVIDAIADAYRAGLGNVGGAFPASHPGGGVVPGAPPGGAHPGGGGPPGGVPPARLDPPAPPPPRAPPGAPR